MYTITKEFDFCYGHRVHNQRLNAEFSLDSCLVCRHAHGHQGKIIVNLTAEDLKDGMVTDFKHLNFFKKWIDDTLDHKFIIDVSDPVLKHMFPLVDLYKNAVTHVPKKNLTNISTPFYRTIDIKKLQDQSIHIQEIYEGLIIVDFVPTSENICKWLYTLLYIELKSSPEFDHVTIRSVEFKETPKTSAIYGSK